MARANVTKRPHVDQWLQYDGTNGADIDRYIADHRQINGIDTVVTHNEDGTISADYGIYGTVTISVGDWLWESGPSGGAPNPVPDADFRAEYQILTGAEPRSYDITES